MYYPQGSVNVPPLRGGSQAILWLLRVAQRAGQSDWKADRRDDRRAALDYAQVLEELSDVHFPDAQQITLVEDNLSTHTAASLYSAFSAPEPPRKAVRMALRSQTWKLPSPAIPPRPQIRNEAKHGLQESSPSSPARGVGD